MPLRSLVSRLSCVLTGGLLAVLCGCGGGAASPSATDAAGPNADGAADDGPPRPDGDGAEDAASLDLRGDLGSPPSPDGRGGMDGRSGPEAGIPADRCFAGATCTGAGVCLRSCFAGRVNRCFCSVGRLFCTGCMAADAGTGSDARDVPHCEGAASLDGAPCRRRGDVCDFVRDAMQRLCVCGEIGSDLVWICQ